MKHFTYRLLSALLMLYVGLVTYRTDDGQLWITSNGEDIRFIPLLLLGVIILLVDVLRSLGNSKWNKNISQQVYLDGTTKDLCKICNSALKSKEQIFCGNKCKFISYRWKLIGLGIIGIIATFPMMEINVIFLVFYILGVIGIEKNPTSSNFPKIRNLDNLHSMVQDWVGTVSSGFQPKYDAIPVIKVEGTGENIRICCYQTARLGEFYCKCGRSVSKHTIKKIIQ